MRANNHLRQQPLPLSFSKALEDSRLPGLAEALSSATVPQFRVKHLRV